eukprot:TRINITY_DN8200_c1_g1_i6.p1 TRINITY_DN8200_c1_g1~~TRINITY_DN8200_c1_g1_i6.p1  ORF type:complete len:318 (-),score=81.46 TRINITY_DN8200_c1_g1_i6:227-1108(-)
MDEEEDEELPLSNVAPTAAAPRVSGVAASGTSFARGTESARWNLLGTILGGSLMQQQQKLAQQQQQQQSPALALAPVVTPLPAPAPQKASARTAATSSLPVHVAPVLLPTPLQTAHAVSAPSFVVPAPQKVKAAAPIVRTAATSPPPAPIAPVLLPTSPQEKSPQPVVTQTLAPVAPQGGRQAPLAKPGTPPAIEAPPVAQQQHATPAATARHGNAHPQTIAPLRVPRAASPHVGAALPAASVPQVPKHAAAVTPVHKEQWGANPRFPNHQLLQHQSKNLRAHPNIRRTRFRK